MQRLVHWSEAHLEELHLKGARGLHGQARVEGSAQIASIIDSIHKGVNETLDIY